MKLIKLLGQICGGLTKLTRCALNLPQIMWEIALINISLRLYRKEQGFWLVHTFSQRLLLVTPLNLKCGST